MTMKHSIKGIILAVSAVMALYSCSNQYTPEQQATLDLISSTSGELKEATFTAFAIVDSTTVKQELKRREALFATKVRTTENLSDKYRRNNMLVNAEKNAETSAQAKAILADIKELEKELEPCSDSIIYRTYKFSCKGEFVDGKAFEAHDMYVNITPDGKACNLRNDSHYNFGMGVAIPGYSELIEKNRISEE